MKTALETRCDFTVQRLAPDLTPQELLKEILALSASAVPGDTILIYFSGHGELVKGRLFLLLSGTNRTIFDSAINAHYILDALQFSSAKNKLLILDCCHAGRAAGFKGTESFPEDMTAGSELILCASDHLEKTREIAEMCSGFMTYHICSILNASRPASMTLGDLAAELRRRASSYNASNLEAAVPLPYLFGTDKSTFLIKKFKGSNPVLANFDNTDRLDTTEFSNTIRQYLKWPTFEHVPIEVNLPLEFDERVEVLASYLKTDRWPCPVDDSTKEMTRTVIEKYIPETKQNAVRVIKRIMNLGVKDDKTDFTYHAKLALASYLESKIVSLRRVLHSCWLLNEADVDWRVNFRHLDHVWSPQLIYGLTLSVASDRTWSFWTDADWLFEHERLRIFVPQFFGNGQSEVLSYDENTFYKALVPQLMESEDQEFARHLYVVLALPYSKFLNDIHVRGESIIETESHNFPDANGHTRTRATRVAAEILSAYFSKLPQQEQRDFAVKIRLKSSILSELTSKVIEMAPGKK